MLRHMKKPSRLKNPTAEPQPAPAPAKTEWDLYIEHCATCTEGCAGWQGMCPVGEKLFKPHRKTIRSMPR